MSFRHAGAEAAFLLSVLLWGCSPSVTRQGPSEVADTKYDSEFPSRPCSEELEEISASVKLLSTMAYYRAYPFSPEEHVRVEDITPDLLKRRENESVFVNRSLSGTATIIFAEGRRVALLTAAHIVAFPDTTLAYVLDERRHQTPFLRTVAIKERQMNFVGVLPEGGELEILAMDKSTDVAILGKTFQAAPAVPLPVFKYPMGKAKELEWGTFLYLFGYPSGYRMVTRGIVSDPNRDRRASFLVDAVFGGGFSGGIALAIRDGVPNFELVGMVKLVSARSSFSLTPARDDGTVEYDPTVPYTGEIFVERRTDIEYGVTQAISSESILQLLEQNRQALDARGFRITFRAPKGK